jgi:hypothetical protein
MRVPVPRSAQSNAIVANPNVAAQVANHAEFQAAVVHSLALLLALKTGVVASGPQVQISPYAFGCSVYGL